MLKKSKNISLNKSCLLLVIFTKWYIIGLRWEKKVNTTCEKFWECVELDPSDLTFDLTGSVCHGDMMLVCNWLMNYTKSLLPNEVYDELQNRIYARYIIWSVKIFGHANTRLLPLGECPVTVSSDSIPSAP